MLKTTFSTLFICFFCFSNLIWAQSSLSEIPNGNLVEAYLNDHKDQWGLVSTDLDDLVVSSYHTDQYSGISHIYVQQRFQQIPIYGALATIGIKNNQAFSSANRFVSNIAQKVNTVNSQLSPSSAVFKLASHYDLGEVTDLEIINENINEFEFSSAFLSNKMIPVKKVFFLQGDQLRLAWDLNVDLKNQNHHWSARIDAISGEVLQTNDMVLFCQFDRPSAHDLMNMPRVNLWKNKEDFGPDGAKYRVFSLPTESPIHGTHDLITDPANLTASPFGWHDTDGVDGPEYTITRGNNAYAYDDINADDAPGYSPDGGSNLVFDFPVDTSNQPETYIDGSLTNLFYINNTMHDLWYHYGFDEASGNFQENNYGKGGVEGDFVNAEGQDGFTTNNATFNPGGPDGSNGQMQMFLFDGLARNLTIPSGSLAGTYVARPADFGSSLPQDNPISANLVLANDGLGDVYDACEPIMNGNELSGQIAVIKRMTCEFGSKVLAAQNNGAIAVIIINTEGSPLITMSAGTDGGSVTIPSVMISYEDGIAFISALEGGETIVGELMEDPNVISNDGSLDNGIVAHEYGHGISLRLAGGSSTVGCLDNIEQMGEGWSDWFTLITTMDSGDQGSDIRGVGTYALSQPTNGGGIRPAPYSTDFAVNNYTYDKTNDTANITRPHGIGFIWATMLWDLTWAYIDKYGFDSDFYNGTGGNNKVMRLIMEGIKLQPCSPGFIDGRDAILEADRALTNGENQCMIWEVFARRGLGYSASQGSPDSRLDQQEDYSVPPQSDPTLSNCTLSTDNFGINKLKIFPNPVSGVLHISNTSEIGQAHYRLSDLNGRIVWETNGIFDSGINIDLSSMTSGLYILSVDNGQSRYTRKIIIQ